MRHYVDNGVLEICLGVSYYVTDVVLQPSDSLVSEVRRTLVVADVELRRASLRALNQPVSVTLWLYLFAPREHLETGQQPITSHIVYICFQIEFYSAYKVKIDEMTRRTMLL